MHAPLSLYLYCDQNQVCDYYSRNLIAPASVMPVLPGGRPLSVFLPDCLFITHIPVSPENRGLGEGLATEQRVPVTLEIAVPKGADEALSVMLVGKDKDGVFSVEKKTWADYDKKKHVGAFVLGEIPLSCVKAVLFDTDEDQDRLRRPSQDLMDPIPNRKTVSKPLVGPCPLPENPQSVAFSAEATELAKSAVAGLRCREKLRAAALLFLSGTRGWKLGDWITGLDETLAKFTGISDDAAEKSIPGWKNLLGAAGEGDILPWMPPDGDKETGAQRLYRAAFSFLAAEPYRIGGGNAKTTADMVAELRKIADGEPSFRRELEAISRFLEMPTGGPTLPDLLTELEKRNAPPICTALLMLSRTPNDIEDLEKAVSVYRIDQAAARQAMTLWGALNGLHGVPARGQGFGKEIATAWSFVEARIDALPDESPKSFRPVGPKAVLKGKRLLDLFDIGKTEIIRKEYVFARFRELAGGWKKAPRDIADAVRKAIVAERGKDALATFESMIPAKLSGQIAKCKQPVSRTEWGLILSELSAAADHAFKLDETALCKSVLSNPEQFDLLWRHDRETWENAYRKANPKRAVKQASGKNQDKSSTAADGTTKQAKESDHA